MSEVLSVKGEAGNFQVEVKEYPRYVDMEKCIACGTCAEKCPRKVDDEYNAGLAKRKAIYVQYAQAVPLKYVIDKEHCIYFQKGRCKACQKFCPTGAVDFEQEEQIHNLNVGAILLAPGFKAFDPTKFDTYNYAKLPNVVTSLEFERILSSSGPTSGHLKRPSDEKEPQKIAWLQCVGSRDINRCDNPYCSAVCCMYAIKEAAIAKEHATSDLETTIFFMDMRTHGKDFETYYDRAREEHGVRFVRCRVHSVLPANEDGDLLLKYVDEDGSAKEEKFDMVVLSVGLEVPPELIALAEKLDVKLDSDNFCSTDMFKPVATSRPGIYVCGAFQSPKDIPQSVMEASAAAAEAATLLTPVRATLTKTKEPVPERDVRGEPPRIGVFICHCGVNIGGVVNIDAVKEYVSTLPYVEYVADNLFTCAQDTQDLIKKAIQENNLNRIVVAACTPRTHEPLFQETLQDAGLNKYLFEMANIRNQDSWVHSDEPEKATEKAIDLVKMAIYKAALLEPFSDTELDISQRALVVGGGISGMSAALSLAEQGFAVDLVEKGDVLGGQARRLFKAWTGDDIQENLDKIIKEVENSDKIKVHLNATITHVDGFVGNFKTTVETSDGKKVIEHGATIIATGGKEYRPNEYLYGEHPAVLTHLELDERFIKDDPSLGDINTAVFIQCVGSRIPERPYCSRVCCTHSVESALELKKRNPDSKIYILYRDMRTYGKRETLFKEAREKGVIFIRYTLDKLPQVKANGDKVTVTIFDPILQREVEITADLLTLATAILPTENEAIAQFFKVPVNDDGFFIEAHAKLRPVDFATDGVYLCGLAHYPKPIDESIAQAQAAVARAVTLLSKDSVEVSGAVARVNPLYCSSCGVCVSICPYKAPSFNEQGVAEINPALCKGCGLCAASCRSGAISLLGFDSDQIFSMIEAA